MRSPAISLLFLAIACSGNSLKVGDDKKGGGGTSTGGSPGGGTSNRGGSAPGGTAGITAAGGAAPYGGTSAGAYGGTSAGAAPNAGTGAAPAGGTSTGGTASITSCTDEFPFAGEWRGNILDFYFEPTTEIRLSVREENGGAGGYVGEFVRGTGEPPPPATDPNAPYPTGGDFDGGAGRGSGIEPWPGFPYTVVRGAGCDSAFRVSIATGQTWDSWCALQTPIDNGEYGWGCIVQRGGASSDGVTCTTQDHNGNTLESYPLWRCTLCGVFGQNVCACSQAGCTYNPEPTHVYALTLSADGNVLSGPDPSCGDCTVRLERVE